MSNPATVSRNAPVGARVAGAIGLLAVLSLVLQGVATFGSGPHTIVLLPVARFFAQLSLVAAACVAACAIATALRPGAGGLLAHPALRGAATFFAAATLVAYGIVVELPPLASGVQVWADVGLTLIVPILWLTWWVWCAPHGGLRVVHGLAWLLVPIAMIVVIDWQKLTDGAIPGYGWRALLLLLGVAMLVILVDRILSTLPEK
jgi:hypothetical protein